jgi:hypothetical protein
MNRCINAMPCGALHDKICQSQSHVTTDGQPVSQSWCRAPSGAHDQMFDKICQPKTAALYSVIQNGGSTHTVSWSANAGLGH